MKHKKLEKGGNVDTKSKFPEKGLVEPKLLLKDEALALEIKKMVDSIGFKGSFEEFAVKAMVNEVADRAKQMAREILREHGIEVNSDEEALKFIVTAWKREVEEAAKQYDVGEGWKKLKAKIDEEERKLN